MWEIYSHFLSFQAHFSPLVGTDCVRCSLCATSNCKVGGKEWSHSKDVITKEEFEMICRCVITEVTAFLKDMASRCSPESTL
ncbi:hypothetical protein CHARACLAT_028071 [Characodon lateralis]|uniref:Uncharacterized protein n=1 Tax=Characodon lateralis TaxID=208331 RepID=A0ABU7E486_9TELE|nr:hypothetical protein [Characodon lateralis]